jgi:hypothetical protein
MCFGLGSVSDETWDAICDSLKAHPTLDVLNLWSTSVPAVIISRIQALVDMMKVNMSIHTIHLNSQYSQHELFRGSVIPYLETNRLRPRDRAIQRTCPITYRVKVLGRALLAVRADPNRVWMILSGNAEVAFPSMTATTTPALTLPTRTTTAAPFYVAANAALTVTAIATRTASTTSASVSTAAHVATSIPTADPKRQARP